MEADDFSVESDCLSVNGGGIISFKISGGLVFSFGAAFEFGRTGGSVVRAGRLQSGDE